MPEGHTVHRLATDHSRWLGGQTVKVFSPQGRFADEAKVINGSVFYEAFAHGKHLFYRLLNADKAEHYVHIHLGLYGRFRKQKTPPERTSPNCRLRLQTEKTTLDLSGPTRCELISKEAVLQKQKTLGPDPLRSDGLVTEFMARLSRKRAPIGSALLDQKVIAGLGNIYRAELLFHLRLDPMTPACDISEETATQIWETAVWWLKLGARANRIITTLKEPPKRLPRLPWREALLIYGKDQCPTCQAAAEPMLLGQRKLYWCAHCQQS